MTGVALRALLAERGWTQARFAAAHGVSHRTVVRWCGSDAPVPAYVAKLAAILPAITTTTPRAQPRVRGISMPNQNGG